MGGLIPGDGKEWLLLLAGAALGWWVIGHARTTGKAVPAMDVSNG